MSITSLSPVARWALAAVCLHAVLLILRVLSAWGDERLAAEAAGWKKAATKQYEVAALLDTALETCSYLVKQHQSVLRSVMEKHPKTVGDNAFFIGNIALSTPQFERENREALAAKAKAGIPAYIEAQ